jgi:uncharacterized protein involved in exopolysaccharide biosynthesis/Mrp family chromosome partitioning ATPase
MLLPTGPIVLEEHLGPNDRDLVDVDAIIRFIRWRWRLCLIWIFVGLCVGFAFVMLSPRYYTAIATILLEDRASRPAAEPGGFGAAVIDPAYADSQVQLLQSDEVVGRVVDQNRLTEVKEFEAGGDSLRALIYSQAQLLRSDEVVGPVVDALMSRFAPLFSPGAATQPTPRDATIGRVKDALSIRRLGLSNAVEIGFTSRDPLRSAAIANAIAHAYIGSQIDLKRKAAEDAVSRLRNSLAEIRDKAFAIESSVEGSLLTTPEAGAQAQARNRELQNRAETYRVLYNSLLQRSYMESVDQLSFSSARVITSAEAPRSWPRPILVLAIAAACGAVTGIAHALFRQARDHSLGTREDVQRSTGPCHIASVSKIKMRAWKSGSLRRDLQHAYMIFSPNLYSAMGKLAVTLQGRRSRQSGLIIGVAAPTPGTGASSVAAHLSRVIAETGQKTLLVDANWRKPSIALGAPDEKPGRKLARALATVPMEPESLDVLVLRPGAATSELNASLSIVTTLQQLQAEYDCMVVDFHSAEQTADLEASMTAINEVIVVVEARRTSSDSLGRVLRLIPRDKIAAVVLNKV